MKEAVLPKKTLFLWQVRCALAGLLLVTGCSFLCLVSAWFTILILLIVAFLAVAMFWYLPRYFRSYKLLFQNGVIIVNRGVIIKTSHIMPFSRMVYAQSYSTPLAKAMGLTAMSLKAARTSLFIPEISEKDANNFIASFSREDDK